MYRNKLITIINLNRLPEKKTNTHLFINKVTVVHIAQMHHKYLHIIYFPHFQLITLADNNKLRAKCNDS